MQYLYFCCYSASQSQKGTWFSEEAFHLFTAIQIYVLKHNLVVWRRSILHRLMYFNLLLRVFIEPSGNTPLMEEKCHQRWAESLGSSFSLPHPLSHTCPPSSLPPCPPSHFLHGCEWKCDQTVFYFCCHSKPSLT